MSYVHWIQPDSPPHTSAVWIHCLPTHESGDREGNEIQYSAQPHGQVSRGNKIHGFWLQLYTSSLDRQVQICKGLYTNNSIEMLLVKELVLTHYLLTLTLSKSSVQSCPAPLINWALPPGWYLANWVTLYTTPATQHRQHNMFTFNEKAPYQGVANPDMVKGWSRLQIRQTFFFSLCDKHFKTNKMLGQYLQRMLLKNNHSYQ